MKKILLSALLVFPALCQAQSDFATVFEIPGGLTAGNTTYTRLELDVNLGSRYLAVNGVLMAGSLASPATGTCFVTSNNGVYCNLQIDQNSYTLDLGPELTGTVSAKGPSGATIDSDNIFLMSAQ